MKRIAALALALAALSLPAAAEAQSLPYMTVDAVSVSTSEILVTGVVQGAAAQTEARFSPPPGLDAVTKAAALESCHRMLMLALSKPGQYLARFGYHTCEVALVKP